MQTLEAIDLVQLVTVTGGGGKKISIRGEAGFKVPTLGVDLSGKGEYNSETTTDPAAERIASTISCINTDLATVIPDVDKRIETCMRILDKSQGIKSQ
jgi:hypothetical protein